MCMNGLISPNIVYVIFNPCLSVRLSVCLSTCVLFICLFIGLFDRLFIYLFIECLFVFHQRFREEKCLVPLLTCLYAIDESYQSTGPAAEEHGEDGQVDGVHVRVHRLCLGL